MAKQFINIGIEGNDGTGDSIRDAFNKTNENFTELYAVFGQGGQIGFTSLSDTPDQLGSNKIPVSNSAGTAIEMKGITGTGISVDFNSDPANIQLSVTSTNVASDQTPSLGGPLNANGFAISNIGLTQTAINDYNSTHSANITLDDLVINKRFADQRYLRASGLGTGSDEIRVRSEPANATEYTKTITTYSNGNLGIPNHGFNAASNGLSFIYNSTGSNAVGLVSGTTYFIRYVDDNNISLHASKAEATNDDDATRVKIIASGGTGTQTIVDADYDSTLEGNYLATEAIQRQSAVRRQGDTMSGPLFLNDHPGDLAGAGSPTGADDLLAASKYYVDNTSYASTVNLFVSTNGDDAMPGVPADKFGRSLSYAYKSISAAAQRAEQIIETSPWETGPYTQIITYGNGVGNSTVLSAGRTGGLTADGTRLKQLMDANKQFIIKETLAILATQYPNFVYDVALCERDLGLIQDAIVLDVTNSTTANYQTRQAGYRYYNSNSGLKAINQQLTETLAAINEAENIILTYVLRGVIKPSPAQTGVAQVDLGFSIPTVGPENASVVNRLGDLKDIIQNYSVQINQVDGRTYTMTIDNNNIGYVDQNSPNNKDLVPGKLIRGKTSGALGEIVSITSGGSSDTVELFLREPIEFTVGEEMEFGNKVKNKQITIFIESGIYYEHFPIKVPANVSIKGDEFRRTIIRPLDAVSQSPWARIYFFRNTTFDGLTIGSQEYGYHYLTNVNDPNSTPKNNKDMDVFLMNDAVILRNLTVQGHGGFMEVLDPNGQVLTKSPYTQTASSFSQSINAQAFRGGMYVDGFAGNVQTQVVNVNSPFNLDVASLPGTGLFLRKPQTPAPFYIDGARYQVSAITNYDSGLGTATLILADNSNSGNGWDGTWPTPYDIIIQTAGNRSLLANDFTQVNDLGYGLVATNGGLSEQVSTFTYYCHTALFALDGGQIRALNCSSAHGNFGLKAEGSNPNEKIDAITLGDNMTQAGVVFNDGTVDYAQPPSSTAVYIYDLEYVPFGNSEIEIDHGGQTGIVRYEVTNIETTTAPQQPALRDGTVYKVNLGTGGSNLTSTTGLKGPLLDGDTVIIRSSRAFRFTDLEDVSPTRPSTAIVFDEYTDAVYRSIAFQVNNPLGQPLPANSAIIEMDSPYDTVKINVNMQECVNNTHAGSGTTMGNTPGDVVIAVDLLTQQSDIDRLNNGDMLIGWDGKVHRILNYTDRVTYATIELADVNDVNATPVGTGIHSSMYRLNTSVNLRANLAAGEPGTLTVSISTCRATGHDFLDIGTGGFNTTNYPNVIYGDPQTPDQANEVIEVGKGRCFYVSTDQDGFFRVGRFFTVDQGTGQVTFSASIALSNLDGIGFKRGVVVAEFSSDTAMTDNASDTVPTESAVRGYVNRRLHFDHNNQLVVNPIGAGVVARDGSTPFTDNISAGGFKLTNLQDPGVDQDAATKSYVDAVNYATDQIIDNRDVNIITPIQPGQLLIWNGAYRIWCTPSNNGQFGGGDTITGSATGTQATIIDLQQQSMPGYGQALRITYTVTQGNNFTTADEISSGGVTANVIDGPMQELGNAVEDVNSDISISASRDASATTIDLQLNAGSIINADVNAGAGIQQSKLDMQAATTRVNATGITQAELGLASFDDDDFEITDGWVTLKSGSVDLVDIENISQYQALGRNTSGTGDVEAVSYSSIIDNGGGVADSDFLTTVGAANDPGEALIKTGAGTYAVTNVSNTREANSILKTDANAQLDVDTLAVEGSQILSVDGSTLQIKTPAGIIFGTAIGSTQGNTQVAFNGNAFAFGGADASTSPSNNDGQSRNSTPALASGYIYTKFIESNAKTNNFTGIALGSDNPYIDALDESSEGKVAFVADGVTPVIATPEGLIPGSANMNIGTSGKRYNTMYATVFDGVATSAQYADLAERFKADYKYQPGTVLMFGGPKEVTISAGEQNTQVAGVVSTDPAYLMNTALTDDTAVDLAMTGRVPCRVIGKIRKGDMLVTSKENGVATASDNPKLGSVIGKALQNYDSDQIGEIEIVVGKL